MDFALKLAVSVLLNEAVQLPIYRGNEFSEVPRFSDKAVDICFRIAINKRVVG